MKPLVVARLRLRDTLEGKGNQGKHPEGVSLDPAEVCPFVFVAKALTGDLVSPLPHGFPGIHISHIVGGRSLLHTQWGRILHTAEGWPDHSSGSPAASGMREPRMPWPLGAPAHQGG